MNDLRSSKQQLREELQTMHSGMTDPVAIANRKRKEEAIKRIKTKRKQYGL